MNMRQETDNWWELLRGRPWGVCWFWQRWREEEEPQDSVVSPRQEQHLDSEQRRSPGRSEAEKMAEIHLIIIIISSNLTEIKISFATEIFVQRANSNSKILIQNPTDICNNSRTESFSTVVWFAYMCRTVFWNDLIKLFIQYLCALAAFNEHNFPQAPDVCGLNVTAPQKMWVHQWADGFLLIQTCL